MSSINFVNGGLDVGGIVENLMYLEQEPIRRMQSQTSAIQAKINAFQAINGKLSSLLTKLDSILYSGEAAPLSTPGTFQDRLEHSVFSNRKVKSSNESVISATASKGTSSGAYAITVTALAKSESAASANFADTGTTKTGTGTLVFTVGTDAPVTVTIDSTNNTLEGVRRAINDAKAGVSATIINDGTPVNPYRLLLTSDETGLANKFVVTDNLAGGKSLALAQTIAAADAEFQVNGVGIKKSSNTVSDVISGVSFTLHDESATAVNLTVDRDADAMVTAVGDLVSAYNEVNTSINSQSKYNATTKTAGVLSGNSALRGIQASIQSLLTQIVSNDHTTYSIVSQVGLNFNNDGSITLNETTLRDAIAKDSAAVAGVFLGDGAVSDSRVTYNGQTAATKAGSYAVQVATLAERAAVTGSAPMSDPLDADETLTVTLGGASSVITLAAGSSLSQVVSAINTQLLSDSLAATAADDGNGALRIFSTAYGSSQLLQAISSRAAGAGTTQIGDLGLSGTGVDIAGSINGHAAVRSGLTLTGAGGFDEEGLSLTIAQTTVGSYGTIRVADGTTSVDGASPLVNLRSSLKSITDPLAGPIHNSTESLTSNIRALNDQIRQVQDRLEIRKDLLTREYSKADEALRLMSVTQSSLAAQLSSLSKTG